MMNLGLDKAKEAMVAGDMDMVQEIVRKSRLAPASNGKGVQLDSNTDDFFQSLNTAAPGAIPTGLPELDALWQGGSRPGELGMVVAPTGVGKSMFVSLLTASARWAGKSVIYFTYELNPQQIRDRIALAMLGKGKGMMHGTWADEIEFARLSRGLTADPPVTLEIHNDADAWPDVEAKLEAFKEKYGAYPELVLLDSADDVAFRGKFEKRHEALLETFVYLRRLAQEKDIAIWTTGQLNRESIEKARVNFKMIGDAFAKVKKSHYCLGLAQRDEDRQHVSGPKMHVYVLKDSNWGTTGGWLECAAAWGHGRPGLSELAY